ncbi:hypothetical protein AOLI_G00083570 [Acnodon oligacanthus]
MSSTEAAAFHQVQCVHTCMCAAVDSRQPHFSSRAHCRPELSNIQFTLTKRSERHQSMPHPVLPPFHWLVSMLDCTCLGFFWGSGYLANRTSIGCHLN